MKRLLIVIELCLCAVGQGQANPGGVPEWLSSAVFYQIYPSSYMDSDGDGIGDLKGIETKLDYIRDLGVTALWLNPVFVSGWQDGGYDVIDFYQVDPRFGSNTDLVQLVDAVHSRGMKICLDLVAGHTSDRCEWFLQSKRGKDLRYSDYYIWADDIADDEKEQIRRRHEQPDPSSSTIGRFVQADAPRAKYYEKNYYESQPALNYGYAHPDPAHPWEQSVDDPGPRATRQELKNIMSFWFDKGIDGFRVDLASSLIKNDDKNKSATSSLWQEMRRWRDENYPDKVLIAEWFNPLQSIPAGFDLDFYSLTQRRGPDYLSYFSLKGDGQIQGFLEEYKENYLKTRAIGYIAVPTGNHDNPRIRNGDRNTEGQLKVAMTFFLTLPGVPLIYYGDEIGMKYQCGLAPKEGSRDRAGTRTPMQWDDSPSAGFSSADPEDLYFPVDTNGGRISVQAQEKDPESLLNHVKTLLSLRRKYSALGNDGLWEVIGRTDDPYPLAYRRYDETGTFIIAVNPSSVRRTVFLPERNCTLVNRVGKAKLQTRKSGTTLILDGCSSIILTF